MTRDITIVRGDDWTGVYVNGKLKYENHSIDGDEMLDILGIKHAYITADEEWLCDRGHLPYNLADVVVEGQNPIAPKIDEDVA